MSTPKTAITEEEALKEGADLLAKAKAFHWMSSDIRTYSHTLSDDAFEFLNTFDWLRASEVHSSGFRFSVKIPDLGHGEISMLESAFHTINAFIIALNSASVGHFCLAHPTTPHPAIQIRDHFDGPVKKTVLTFQQSGIMADPDADVLSKDDVRRALIIFRGIRNDDTIEFMGEYNKGLALFGMSIFEMSYRREAYLCFYRAIENMVTTRILKVKNLTNELKQIQSALSMIGISKVICDEFREIYAIRCGQVAHSQKALREVTSDEVRKVKMFLDAAAYKLFKKEADEKLIAKRGVAGRKGVEKSSHEPPSAELEHGIDHHQEGEPKRSERP